MWRLIKTVLVLTVIVGGATIVSFAGSRVRLGQYLGRNLPDLGPLQWTIAFGAKELPDKPIAWSFSYNYTNLRGLPRFTVFISPTGKILGSVPRNLPARLDPYRQRLP